MSRMDTNRFRELLPAPGTPEQSRSNGHPLHPASESRVRSRRQLTRVACNACRWKKSKCDGRRPVCSRCVAEDIECRYDSDPDVSRAVALRRKNESLTQDVRQLRHLVDRLCSLPSAEAHMLLNELRESQTGKRLEPIIFPKLDHTANSSHLNAIASQLKLAAHDTERTPRSSLRPLYRLRARPWTDVIENDLLISHLLSMYITWDAYFISMLEPDNFLQDMARGSLNCKYCSPFLVNAMLSLACVGPP